MYWPPGSEFACGGDETKSYELRLEGLVPGRNDLSITFTPEDNVGKPALDQLKITVVDTMLWVDRDRNELVTEERADLTHDLLPMIFWYNNDRDFGPQVTGDIDEAPTTADYADEVFKKRVQVPSTIPRQPPTYRTVRRIRDLEDFARMRLVVRGIDSYIRAGDLTVGMRWVSTPTHALRVKAYRNSDKSRSMDYLQNMDVANRICDKMEKVAEVTDTTVKLIDRKYLQTGYGGYHSPWLWCANGDVVRNQHPEQDKSLAKAGEGRWAVVICPPASKNPPTRIEAANPHFHFQAADFRQYYEHQTAGDTMTLQDSRHPWPEPTLSTTGDSGPATLPGDDPHGIWDPRLTHAKGSDQVILHVHGYRRQPWERRSFAETAAKRLYWEGYGGRMVFFSWPTEYVADGYLPQIWRPQNYDRSEFQARRCGTMVLPKIIDGLVDKFGQQRLIFIAHSMGNVVLAEALRTYTSSDGILAHKYLAMQSAEVSGAFQNDNAHWLFPEGFSEEFAWALRGRYMPDLFRFSVPREPRALVTEKEWDQARIRWAPPNQDVDTYSGRNAAELNRLVPEPAPMNPGDPQPPDLSNDGPTYHHTVTRHVGKVMGIVNGNDPATASAWELNQFTKIDVGFDYRPIRLEPKSPNPDVLVSYLDSWRIDDGYRALYRIAPFNAFAVTFGYRSPPWDSVAVDRDGTTARCAILAFITRSRTLATGACTSLRKFYTETRNIQEVDGFKDNDLDHSAQYNYSLVRTHELWKAIYGEVIP